MARSRTRYPSYRVVGLSPSFAIAADLVLGNDFIRTSIRLYRENRYVYGIFNPVFLDVILTSETFLTCNEAVPGWISVKLIFLSSFSRSPFLIHLIFGEGLPMYGIYDKVRILDYALHFKSQLQGYLKVEISSCFYMYCSMRKLLQI